MTRIDRAEVRRVLRLSLVCWCVGILAFAVAFVVFRDPIDPGLVATFTGGVR